MMRLGECETEGGEDVMLGWDQDKLRAWLSYPGLSSPSPF